MPYKIFWEEDCVTVEWSGKITYMENMEANGLIYGNKRYDTIHFQKSILLEADLSLLKTKNVKVIGELDKKSSIWNKDLTVVHIATDPFSLELISSWENTMKDSGWVFRTFKDLKSADSWIEKMRKSI